MKKLFLFILAFVVGTGISRSQNFDGLPVGAQVFIEPGQSYGQVEEFFRLMSECNMTAGRIRLFGAHILKDGKIDFSLYDKAFDCAEKYGIGLFATLFPPTDELHDVGGFKFPSGKRHLDEIDDYIRIVVSHYKDHPALRAWVLQNEPGSGSVSVPDNDLADSLYMEFIKVHHVSKRGNGYLKADFTDEKFIMWYTTWYLRHISDLVYSIDPVHGRHVNPHQILGMLTDYDFAAYEKFLTSLGASMHFSWHFGMFDKSEYMEGVSLMSDVIRSAAGCNPFWVTELQGGNVTASGAVPYCPSADDIVRSLWIAAGAGAEGMIFWTLNARKAVNEAGEWAMTDYLGKPSDRLLAASEVAACFNKYSNRLKSMSPYRSGISILYNVESLWIQRRNSALVSTGGDARKQDAVMKSAVVAYQTLLRGGVVPEIVSMDNFDWDDGKGRVAILSHTIACPSRFWDKIDNFVRTGGKLIVTGLSCYYDEYMRCLFMDDFPLADCFGSRLSEFKVCEEYFLLDNGLKGHLWKGFLMPGNASAKLYEDGRVLCVRNKYGDGEVVWLPAPVELGAYHDSAAMENLWRFYLSECSETIARQPVRFARYEKDAFMRIQQNQDEIISIIVNRADTETDVNINTDGLSRGLVLWGMDPVSDSVIRIPPKGVSVIMWKQK